MEEKILCSALLASQDIRFFKFSASTVVPRTLIGGDGGGGGGGGGGVGGGGGGVYSLTTRTEPRVTLVHSCSSCHATPRHATPHHTTPHHTTCYTT